MALSDLKIIKGNGGLGRRSPSKDGVIGLLTTGVAVSGKLALGTVYKLQQIEDLIALGVDADYDTTNLTLIYYQVSEIFRVNPDATVWLLVATIGTAMADLADPTKSYGPKIIQNSEYSLVQLGICLNTGVGYAETLTDGLDAQVFLTVAQAQLLADYADSMHAPLSAIVVEGLHFNGTATLAKDLRTLGANKVSVVIAQDKSSAAATAKPNHAAVGTVLGCISLAKVNENIGWPEKFGITNTKQGKWLKAGVSGGISLNSFTLAQLNILDDKGYIFARSIPQLSGLYFNNSYTATTIDDDYANIELNRTIDKAIKVVRGSLVPKLNSPLLVDSDTGFLQPVTIADFETQAQAALDLLQRDGEISGGEVYINPEQNVLSTNTLAVKVSVVPTGTAQTIEVEIGFNNPFKS